MRDGRKVKFTVPGDPRHHASRGRYPVAEVVRNHPDALFSETGSTRNNELLRGIHGRQRFKKAGRRLGQMETRALLGLLGHD